LNLFSIIKIISMIAGITLLVTTLTPLIVLLDDISKGKVEIYIEYMKSKGVLNPHGGYLEVPGTIINMGSQRLENITINIRIRIGEKTYTLNGHVGKVDTKSNSSIVCRGSFDPKAYINFYLYGIEFIGWNMSQTIPPSKIKVSVTSKNVTIVKPIINVTSVGPILVLQYVNPTTIDTIANLTIECLFSNNTYKVESLRLELKPLKGGYERLLPIEEIKHVYVSLTYEGEKYRISEWFKGEV